MPTLEKTPFGLSETAIEKIRSVFAAHLEIEKVVLYGSRAKGNYKPGSDIDLTIHGKNLSMGLLLKLGTELDDLLLPYRIDLSLFEHIDNPKLLSHIDRVGVVFYQRN